VAAVVADHKQSPEHGALSNPVQRPCPPAQQMMPSEYCATPQASESPAMQRIIV
jgi:hypothetical protein